MKRIRILTDFEWWGPVTRKCVLCKVLGLYVFKAAPDPIIVPDDAAAAAIAAGAAREET